MIRSNLRIKPSHSAQSDVSETITFNKKGFEISRRLSPKNMVEGGCKSRGARFEVESSEKKSAPLSVPIEKRVHPYLFRPKKECRPICSALKNDVDQAGPHLYGLGEHIVSGRSVKNQEYQEP